MIFIKTHQNPLFHKTQNVFDKIVLFRIYQSCLLLKKQKNNKKKHHLTFKFTIKNMIKKKNYSLFLFRAQFMQTKNKQINQQTTIKQHALIL